MRLISNIFRYVYL